MTAKKMIQKNSTEVISYKNSVEKAKTDAEVVTLREWYDSTLSHNDEIKNYIKYFKQLGRLGKELHKRGVPRVTERFGDEVRTLVEATYIRRDLDWAAPLCAYICVSNKKNKALSK